MQSRSEQNRIRYTHRLLTETTPAARRSTSAGRLLAGELLMLGLAALPACFASAGLGGWLYPAALLYLAGLVLTDAGRSARKAALFALPMAVALLGSRSGFLHFANQVVTVYNARAGAFAPLLEAPECSAANALLFEMGLAALLAWLVYGALSARGVGAVTLLSLAALAALALGGLSVRPAFCGALVLGWLLCWVRKTAGASLIRKSLLYFLPLAAGLCLVVTLTMAGARSADALAGLLHSRVTEAIDTFRYGSDTLPRGDMTRAAGMGAGQEDVLTVTFEGRVQALYLRGFVGGDFSGTAWAAPDAALYHGQNEGIIDWLDQNGLCVPFQYGTYFTFTAAGASVTPGSVQVINQNARRDCLYLPYQALAVTNGGWMLQNDSGLQSTGLFGARHYTVSTAGAADFGNSILQEPLDSDLSGAAEFEHAEQIYRAFAAEQYLNVPDAARAAIREQIFGGQDWTGAGISQLTTQIRLMLQSRVGYTAAPAAYTGEEDFLDWLLNGQESCNSAGFATAAVLAYRCAGIPARYAEGYYLSPTAAQALRTEGEQTAVLDADTAHAWVEIYRDGLGWIPVETTPGFYNAEYALSQVLGQPESAVNIAGSEDADKLQGSTADTLQQLEEEEPPQKESAAVVQHLLGTLLLTGILLLAAHWVLELQALLRCAVRCRKRRAAQPAEALRMIFSETFLLLKARGTPANAADPGTAAPLFDALEGVEPEEYLRLVALLEKVVFGEMEPDEGELTFAERFLERLTEAALHGAAGPRRLMMRYGYAVCG